MEYKKITEKITKKEEKIKKETKGFIAFVLRQQPIQPSAPARLLHRQS